MRGISKRPGSALLLGKSWHEALETNYTQKITTKVDLPIEEMKDAFSDSFDRMSNDDDYIFDPSMPESKLKDQGIGLTEIHHKEIAPTINPVSVEEKFDISLGDDFPFTLLGFIDLIDEKDSGEYIVDNKSLGKKPSQSDMDKNIQLTAYALAYRMTRGKEESGLRFDCAIKNKNPQVFQIETKRTTSEIEWFLSELVGNVAGGIKSGIFFPNPTGWHCSEKWCGYWGMCKKTNYCAGG
jgi:putative RecB family exonuclease